MTGRLKLLAAALGLVLATGTIADAATATAIPTQHVQTVKHVGKPLVAKLAIKSHRIHVANWRHAHKLRIARHLTGHRIVKAKLGAKTVKEAGVTMHRERHAMNHRVTSKPVSVIR